MPNVTATATSSKSFRTSDTYLVRGWATAGDWTGPFLKLSYRGGPDSKLSQASGHRLGSTIRLYLKVRDASTATPLSVPYNEESHCYEIELWGYPGSGLAALLDQKGAASLATLRPRERYKCTGREWIGTWTKPAAALAAYR